MKISPHHGSLGSYRRRLWTYRHSQPLRSFRYPGVGWPDLHVHQSFYLKTADQLIFQAEVLSQYVGHDTQQPLPLSILK